MNIPPINPNDNSSEIKKAVKEQPEKDTESVFEEEQNHQKKNEIHTGDLNEDVSPSKKKDGGIWASILEATKGFFDKNKSEAQIETERILEEKGITDTVSSSDVKNRNTFLEAKRQEYLVSHPEPVFNEADNPGMSIANQEALRSQWQNGLNQFIEQETNKYKTENTETKSKKIDNQKNEE